MAFLGVADSEVHIFHITHVNIAYTLESLSSPAQITHNIQATINFKNKDIKYEQQKSKSTHNADKSLEKKLDQFTWWICNHLTKP